MIRFLLDAFDLWAELCLVFLLYGLRLLLVSAVTLALVAGLFALAGCGGGDVSAPVPPTERPSGEIRALDRVESMPVFHAGELRELVSARSPTDPGHGELEEWRDGVQVGRSPLGLMLPALLSEGETLHAFGVPFSGASTWCYAEVGSPPVPVLEALPGEGIFNASVCRGPDGLCYAAIEVSGLGEPFSTRFAVAAEPDGPWTWIDATFGVEAYAACPLLRYVDGRWVLLVLRSYPWGHGTTLAVAADLAGPWHEVGPVLVPTAEEGSNASDAEIVETPDGTWLYYCDGNQQTRANVRRMRLEGGLAAWVETMIRSNP